MPVKTIILPEQMDGLLPQAWGAQLEEYAAERELAVDFSRVKFACPLGILTTGREIRRVVAQRLRQGRFTMVAGRDMARPALSFLGHVGFFDFIGLANAKQIGAAKGSSSYVPIRRFTRAEVAADPKRMRENVASKAKDLAVVLAGSAEVPAFWPVAYSIREVIRNVFEHSGADECFVTAQRWFDGAVEMAVVDEGMGIRASLAPVRGFTSDTDAVSEAIKPGVTRTSRTAPEDDDGNSNSGFGLYVLSELGRCFGRFTLASGAGCVSLGAGAAVGDPAQFSGTAVGLRLDSLPHSFDGTLEDIVSEGERTAAQEGRREGASKASRSKDIGPRT